MKIYYPGGNMSEVIKTKAVEDSVNTVIKGKEYVVNDGDVITFRFNVY